MKRKYAPLAVVLLLAVYYYCGAEIFAALLLSVTVHEGGHAAAIRICGGRLNDFRMEISGFSMSSSGIDSGAGEIFTLLAGPAAGLLLSAILFQLNGGFAKTTAIISFALSAYNLLPAIPLDGGRVLFIVVSNRCDRESTRKILNVCGVIMGTALVILGTVSMKIALTAGGIWILIAQTGIVKSMRMM